MGHNSEEEMITGKTKVIGKKYCNKMNRTTVTCGIIFGICVMGPRRKEEIGDGAGK